MKKIILLLSCCLVSFIGMSVQAYSMDTVPLWEKLDSPDDCDILGAIHFKTKNKELFEACKNREIVDEEGGYFSVSYLKNCPASHPLKSKEKGCLSCDGLEDVVVMNKEDCNVCSNREIRTEEYEDYVDGKKATEYSYHCQLKQCPDEAPLRGDWECLTCDENVWTDDPKEICDKCPNRQFIKEGRVVFEGTKDGNKWVKKTAHDGCYLKEYQYEESRPLLEVDLKEEIVGGKSSFVWPRYECSDIPQYYCEHMHRFSPCDEKYDIETLPEICAKCPNRDYVEGKCVFRECPSGSIKKIDDVGKDLCVECEHDSYVGETGIIHNNYWHIEIVSQEECHKCSNRFWGKTIGDDGKYVCAHCNIDKGYIASEEECTRCSSRVYHPEMKMCVLKGMVPKRDEAGEIFVKWDKEYNRSSIGAKAIPLSDLIIPVLPSPPADVALFDDEF